jgi:type I restriction enzyme S subunit
MRVEPQSVPMEAFLTHRKEFFKIDDTAEYKRVTAKLHGQGIVPRDQISGSQLRTKKQQRVRDRDLLVAEIDAKVGGVGLVPPTLDGAIVSSHYYLYEVDASVCLPGYLDYYIRSGAVERQFQQFVQGSTNYASIRAHHALALEIPLPPVSEQRRIVARIDELAALVTQAQGLRRSSTAQAQQLVSSAITEFAAHVALDGQLGDVLAEKPRNGWSVRCDGAEHGTPVLRLSAITGYRYRPREFKRTSEATLPEAHYWLHEGDLLISRSNTPELVGHAATYSGSPSPCIYPDLMMRLVVDDAQADPRFVHAWLRGAPARAHIAENARGTSPTMKKITQSTVTSIPFPVGLPLPVQERVVARVERLSAHVEGLVAEQEATQAELDALLPSILDRAFKGEL